MNGRVSRLLRKAAAGAGISPRHMKALWDRTPRAERAAVARKLLAKINGEWKPRIAVLPER